MLTVRLDHQTETGEEITLTVEALVKEHRDPYGTGDSPAEFEINISAVTDESGKDYELSGYMLREAENKLIAAHRGY
jgi:hypothetical protein